MYEIEAKAWVKNKEQVQQKLDELGVRFNDPSLQVDVVYIQGEWEEFMKNPHRKVLRLRTETGLTRLTLKMNGTNELDGREHETSVANAKEMDAIIQLLDYHPFIEVRKQRRKAHYREWEIVMDEVEGLGSFIEVEQLIESDPEGIQEQLFAFLENLGIPKADHETRGYDTLLRLEREGKL